MSMPLPVNLPDDLNVELLFEYYRKGNCKASFKGLHKRNAYSDIIGIEQEYEDKLLVEIARNSLYDALPEYMFHPIDRFNELPKLEEKDRFDEEYGKQEKEKENARRFFAPLDILLLKLRMDVRECLLPYCESNKALIDIIADEMTQEQKDNRFIQQVVPFLPSCKRIRGNKTLLTLMLRKVFIEEGLTIDVQSTSLEFTDTNPRYDYTLGSTLGDCYVGNTYHVPTNVYNIHYWSDDECNENFLTFVKEVDQLRMFIQDYFMSVDEVMIFNIIHDGAPLRLNDDIVFNYLNYNTNI